MEQMLEVRMSNGAIMGWLPPPYRQSFHQTFMVRESLGDAYWNQNQLVPELLQMDKIILSIDVIHDGTDNPRYPYMWRYYKSNVPIEKLRKVRGFVENRPFNEEEHWERDYFKKRHEMLMKLAHPPILFDPLGDSITNMDDIQPGSVIWVPDRHGIEEVREKARRDKSISKMKNQKMLLLVGAR